MHYRFDDYSLDTNLRELRRGPNLVTVEPQVFDLLEYLLRHRERVVSKDDLLAGVWRGRIVSESALTTRINAARAAIGDSGETQHFIKTLRGKGLRFVGNVQKQAEPAETTSDEIRTEPATAPGAVRSAIDRGVAISEHERRSRAELFCRWHDGRNHHRIDAI